MLMPPPMPRDERQRALQALQAIPANIERADWVRVAMGAKAAGLALEDFDAWSATAPDRYQARDTRDVWKSCNAGGGVTAATLFHIAKQHGFASSSRPASVVISQQPKPAPEPVGESAAARLAWDKCEATTADHPYIARKNAEGVPLDGLRMVPADDPRIIAGKRIAGWLAVPAYDGDGNLQAVQFMAGSGDKLTLPGTKMAGAAFIVGHGAPAYVCEGIGTAWAIWQATGNATAVAFGAGNLATIAARYPAAVLVPDAGQEGRAAAISCDVGCRVALMPQGSPSNYDAWDLANEHGSDALAALLAGAAAIGWPDPEPLPDALPPVEAFDPNFLPHALRGWVMDIADRMQCPPDFPAVGALVALSAVVGARVTMAPKERDDWRVVPNLWGAVVGRPGIMKSPAIGQALSHLDVLEQGHRQEWEQAHKDWELDVKVAELAAKANERKATKVAAKNPDEARRLLAEVMEVPDEPVRRRYLVNDSTQEKLADLLVGNPWGLLVYRDELHGLLRSMDKEGQEGARGFYLTGYDGTQGYAVDRIGRGESYVPRVCLSLLGSIQPGKLQAYVRDAVNGGAGDDGLLQRFGLAVWPDVSEKWQRVDRWPDSDAKAAARQVFERLDGLPQDPDMDPETWRFTPEAQERYWQWAESLERELRSDELHPALASHLAKYRKLVPALALLFALVDTPQAGTVGIAELLRALSWGEYLRSHAVRIYAAATVPETAGAQTLLARLQAGGMGDAIHFTAREAVHKGWTGLGKVADVRKAAEMLIEHGWLSVEVIPPGPQGGRPSEVYTLHPVLRRAAS